MSKMSPTRANPIMDPATSGRFTPDEVGAGVGTPAMGGIAVRPYPFGA